MAQLDAYIAPVRERRKAYEAKPQIVDEILAAGAEAARKEAAATMMKVREAMGV